MAAERLTKISKAVDAGTFIGALVFAQMGIISPALAVAAIEAGAVTYAGAEVIESEIKKKKNKQK